MIKRLLLLLSFGIFTGHQAFNQQTLSPKKPQIKGKVLDGISEEPLEFATVTLLNTTDKSLVNGTVTEPDGSFSLMAQAGTYTVKIEFISYQEILIENVIVKANETTDLGTTVLSPAAEVLAEVEVRAEKSQMQMALDKKVFNVGKDLANSSGTASEILDNIPSVMVDVEGNVSLRGSDNVRILVDGKPSGLIGVRGSGGLRSLPANLIEKIEVITNPSSKYEAEGMSGIINIVLKKDRKTGLNGSVDLITGYPANYGAAVNLNFRRNKTNLFANYGFRYSERPGENYLYQELYSNSGTSIVEQFNTRSREGLSHNFRMGMDYFINDRNTLTGSMLYRISENKNTSVIEYNDYANTYQDANKTGKNVREQSGKEDEPTFEINLNHKKTFEQEDRDWTTSLQIRESTEDQFSDYEELFYNADDTPTGLPVLLQRSFNKESERTAVLQSDYVHPFSEEGKWEAGYRGSLRNIDNDYLVEEFADDTWQTLPNLSNDFNYTEQVHALYTNIGNKSGKLSYQAGLRFEYSDILTELLQTGEKNQRDYANLFPSLFLTWEQSEANSIQMSYSRRIRRPRFWDLNPFFTFSDSRNIRSGNPNLNPEFTDSYELSFIKYWETTTFTSSLYYRDTKGNISNVRSLEQQGEDLVTISRPENFGRENSLGLEFILSAEPAPWWRVNGSMNFFYSVVDGSNINESFKVDTYTWFGRVNSRISLGEDLDMQWNVFYRAPRATAQGKSKGIAALDLGMSKEILKNNGTLTLSVRDLFNSRRYRYENYGDNFYSSGSSQWRARQAVLTLNYRINQSQQQRGKGNRRGGGEGGDYGGEEY